MPTVIIGKTNKRINSTSRIFTSSYTKDCKLKEPCSMQKPTFLIKDLPKGEFFNYLEFEGNFYWIDDIAYITRHLQSVHCHIDPLASFYDAIASTKGMVIYGDRAHWDDHLDDGRFSPEVYYSADDEAIDMFGLTPSKQGCVALTFTQTSSVDFISGGASTVTSCGIHTALMSMENFRDCIADLNNFNITGGLIEIAQAFGRAFSGGSLLDNIMRCIWLPFDITSIIQNLNLGSNLRVGLMLGGVLAANCHWYEISTEAIWTHDDEVNIDWNAITGQHRLLRQERFISLQVSNAGGFLNVPLDRLLEIDGNTKLYTRCSFCLTDGSWSFKISRFDSNKDTLVANSGCVGVNLMGTIYMGPTPSNVVADNLAKFEAAAVAIGAGSVIAGVASAGGVGAAASQVGEAASAYGNGFLSTSEFAHTAIGEGLTAQQVGTAAIGTGIMNKLPSSTRFEKAPAGTFGGSASSIFLNPSPGKAFFYAKVYAPRDVANYEDYCAEYGFPVHKYLTLGDLNGFVMCASANVTNAAGASEANKSTINNFLNNGIYIED